MISFFPLFAIFVLLMVAIVLIVLHNTRTGFAYSWLIATLGLLLAWALLFFSRLALPQLIELVSWSPEVVYPVSPTLIIDPISWPFAMALVTLALSTLLTSVARKSEVWSDWASTLSMTAIGLLAVMAGNPLTLILGWAALDLTELLILMWRVEFGTLREHVVVAFSIRIGGIWLLLLGATLTGMFEGTWSFATVSQQASLFLLFAAGLRLGVIYFGGTFRREFPFPRGLGTMLRLAPAGSSLMLLSRTAEVGVPASFVTFLLAITILVAILAGFSWLNAKDELDGQPYWILGMAAFSVASAVRGQSEASLAWGLAAIFSGGLLFLYSVRHRYLLALLILGLLGFSGLPLTPLWNGMRLYASPFSPLLLLFLIPHAMFLAGYLWHALRQGQQLTGVERWIKVIYPWGLSLLPLVYFIVGGWGQLSLAQLEWSRTLLSMVLPSIVTLGLAALIFMGLRMGLTIPESVNSIIVTIFSLNWLRPLLWNSFRALGGVFNFLCTVLEGEGGVLWALLLLILLLVFMANAGLGGV
ncbi:MAG: hypothetical protein IMY76_02025 [Chloroflexi bacterium]|nr:hypothetical protein [Chloroflexota bacterium]